VLHGEVLNILQQSCLKENAAALDGRWRGG
jgi:hypothetical protein